MGVNATNYVMLGVAITENSEVKKFFRINEEYLDFMEDYDDNSNKKEINHNGSGIHVIVDGMSSKYVVVGKILSKSIDLDLSFTEISDIKNQYMDLYPKILVLDQKLGTRFSTLSPKLIVFTHWY